MNLEPMWEALEKYQKYADKRGFGAEWLRMTTERTSGAAWIAAEKADEAWIAGDALSVDGADAAWAVVGVVAVLRQTETDSEVDQVCVIRRSDRAITLITRAIEQEGKE